LPNHKISRFYAGKGGRREEYWNYRDPLAKQNRREKAVSVWKTVSGERRHNCDASYWFRQTIQSEIVSEQGNINIHYVYNQTLKVFDDFKLKP